MDGAIARLLIDRILDHDTLRFAWRRVESARGAAGGDGVSLSRFALRLDHHLLALADEVRAGTYTPGPLRIAPVVIRGKARRLTILCVRDRVLQRAALDVLTPRLDPTFLPCSFGYRPQRSVRHAVKRVVQLRDHGLTWVVDADIDECFPSFQHDHLDRAVAAAIPDLAVRELMARWIRIAQAGRDCGPHRGIPLGAPVSPLLCNLALHGLDRSLKRRRFQPVRYADDFILLCKSAAHAEQGMRETEKVLAGMELRLEPRKTRLTSFEEGFSFLGVRFERDRYAYDVDGKTISVDDAEPPDWWYHHPADPYD